MIFNKNKLINKTLDKYYDTFSHTLDTADYVPEKFNNKITKYIYKDLTKKFKEIEIYNLLYIESLGVKLGVFQRLTIWLSGLRPLYNAEFSKSKQRRELVKDKADYFCETKIDECDSTSALDQSTSE